MLEFFSRLFLASQQYFSLTANQSTVLSGSFLKAPDNGCLFQMFPREEVSIVAASFLEVACEVPMHEVSSK